MRYSQTPVKKGFVASMMQSFVSARKPFRHLWEANSLSIMHQVPLANSFEFGLKLWEVSPLAKTNCYVMYQPEISFQKYFLIIWLNKANSFWLYKTNSCTSGLEFVSDKGAGWIREWICEHEPKHVFSKFWKASNNSLRWGHTSPNTSTKWILGIKDYKLN